MPTQTNKDTQISMQFRQSLWIFVVFVAFGFRLRGESQPKEGLNAEPTKRHESPVVLGF